VNRGRWGGGGRSEKKKAEQNDTWERMNPKRKLRQKKGRWVHVQANLRVTTLKFGGINAKSERQ